MSFMNFSYSLWERVSSLILGRPSLRGFCLFIFEMYLTIGKRIRSNTLSPVDMLNLMNKVE